ncbi:caspase family protein [Granulosicoccus sp. 3-233]|uniref:caspase family protein n=1 Tax=Granulosicoccus sp. 3-233 TaxID=3417969 RepID=UPI003D32F146
MARNVSPLTCLVLVCLLSACGSTPPPVIELPPGADVNELLPVDCLLPGRVRQLGKGRIYQEPHRPVKTTANTCAIRGGDFVRYDRADFRTSLNVWLQAAKDDDPEAQTYVGEIFEKGMGVEADFAEAARWYGLAAAQGHDRARINLGYLYETGLGVEKDVSRALQLYREAAGLDGGTLEYVTHADLAVRKSQKTTLDRTQAELDEARQRLLEMEKSHQEQQAALRHSQQSLRQLQQAADEQRKVLARQRQAAITDDRPLKNALIRVEQLTEELARARDSENRLQGQMTQYRDSEATLLAQLDQLQRRQQDVALQDAQSIREQQDLARQLQELEQRREEAQAGLDAQQAEVQLLEQRYRQQTALHQQEVDALQQQFGASAAESARKLAELEGKLARREQEIEHLEQKLSITGQALLTATVVEDIPMADAVSQVSYAGLRIELVNLRTEILRNGALIAYLPDASHQQVIGQIQPSHSLSRLQINQNTHPWDSDGVFNYDRQGSDFLDIVAQDSAEEKFQRKFQLREPFVASASITSTTVEERSPGSQLDTSRTIDFGDYHALIVGVGDYQQFGPLHHATADAQRVDHFLTREFGFSTRLLIDPGKAELLTRLGEYQTRLDEQDNFVLYYSGHCKPASAYAPSYWLLRDADPVRNESWLSLPSLVSIIDALPARNVLLIADACAPETLTSTAVPVPLQEQGDEEQTLWYRKMVQARVRSVLSSGIALSWSTDTEAVRESPFTTALLDALDTSGDIVPVSRLYAAIREASVKRFRQILSRADVRYAPIRHAGHEAGEFLFVRRASR